MAARSSIRITQRRSASGASPSQRDTLRSLGLRGIGRTVERQDGPELQGMVRAVGHLVEVSNAGGSKSSKDGDGSG
jgi:large subunit ribosomal protein L30